MSEEKNNACDLMLDRLAQNVSRNPAKRAVAFLAGGRNGGSLQKELTYQELETETTKVAKHLIRKGIEKGECVVLVYPPSLDFMIAFLACLKANVVAVPVFPPNPLRRDTLAMFANIVQGCGAKHALTNTEYNHAKKMAGIRDVFTKFQRPTSGWPDDLDWTTTDTLKEPRNSVNLPQPPSDRSQVAFLQYTSGSTSEPKGVMITHGNLAHNLTIITNDFQAKDDTVVVSWLPQYHDMGLIGSYLGVLFCGGTGYYLSPLSFLQRPMVWIEAVSRYRATHLQAPNFAFKLTARKFSIDASNTELDLSSVRHVINAAEPVDEESIDNFYRIFGKYGFANVIYPTYGLAEHTVFVCSGGKQRLTVDKAKLEIDAKVVILEDDDHQSTDIKAVSKLIGCGFPSRQNVDVQIVDPESCKALAGNLVGEIWIRSPSKAAGYFNKPKETKEDFHAGLVSDDGSSIGNAVGGYLRTGDLGFLHKHELFICGRLKDLIIVGGRNYYPQDIEATAEASSDLVRLGCSAAFTIDPTHEGGEEVALVMELKEAPSLKATQTVCESLANQIKSAINQEHSLGLTDIVFLHPRTVPKTSSGKIARSWCRKGFIAGSLKIIFRKSFKSQSFSLEMEETTFDTPTPRPVSSDQSSKIRSMDKKEILAKLSTDISRVASISPDALDKSAALISMLDSLSLSQFKGMLENSYSVDISDEYLFRESTTLLKLVEVVKLGYAPDDEANTTPATSASNGAISTPGQAKGIAGVLGCPPGVVCTIL
jgi:acyl-CoA synthetase (AMP-forming)/AMP-acid ligase II/acyl carrier protein